MTKVAGVIAGILAICIQLLLRQIPSTAEWVYGALYMLLRYIYDYTLGLLPVPGVFSFIILSIAVIYWRLLGGKKYGNKQGGFTWPLRITNGLGWLIFLFYFLWAWNYARPPISQRATLSLEPIPLATLDSAWHISLERMTELRNQLPDRTLMVSDLPNQLESSFRPFLESTLAKLGFPSPGRPRVRLLYPKGLLLRLSTAGVYIPFAMEGHVDPGLHPLQWPSVIAHEMSHGYGVTDEGSCNFTGYLACRSHDAPIVRYSGELGYWRYLNGALRRLDPENYSQRKQQIPARIWADLIEIELALKKYPDIWPSGRRIFYDRYLKSQGISEGEASYSRVIMLVRAWEKRETGAN